jgi:hypothetical protein
LDTGEPLELCSPAQWPHPTAAWETPAQTEQIHFLADSLWVTHAALPDEDSDVTEILDAREAETFDGDSDQMPTDSDTVNRNRTQPEHRYEDWENDEYWDQYERTPAQQRIPALLPLTRTEDFSDKYIQDAYLDERNESVSWYSYFSAELEDLLIPWGIVTDLGPAPHDTLQLPGDLGVLEFDSEVAGDEYFHPILFGDNLAESSHSVMGVTSSPTNWPASNEQGGIWLNDYPVALLEYSNDSPGPDPEDISQPITRIYDSLQHLLSEYPVIAVTDEDINSIVDVVAISKVATDNLYAPYPTSELGEAKPSYMEEYLANLHTNLPFYSEEMGYPGPEYFYASQEAQPLDLDALECPYLASFLSSITDLPRSPATVSLPAMITTQGWGSQVPEFPEEYRDVPPYFLTDRIYDFDEWDK